VLEASALLPEEDLLTVQEAAEALSVSAPRLRRLLARPEWSGRTETRTRQTRTGTRTATVLNRSLLPEIREALAEGTNLRETSGAPSSTIEPERERDATGTGTDRNENENAPDWKTRALVAESERDGLTARLADTQTDRDAWKAQAQELTESLRAALDEVRSARALSSRPTVQIEASGHSSASQSEDSGLVKGITPPAPEVRLWWQFWKGRG
jgi:hypothetical protein